MVVVVVWWCMANSMVRLGGNGDKSVVRGMGGDGDGGDGENMVNSDVYFISILDNANI